MSGYYCLIKRVLRFFLILLTFWGLMFPLTLSANEHQSAAIVGKAYVPDTQVLLYKEIHSFSSDGMQHWVEYFSPQGELMARKAIDYSRSLLSPSYLQSHLMSGEVQGVDWLNGHLAISYQSEKGEETRVAKVQARFPLVIDAGFDHFVRQHWQALTAGEVRYFHFPVATRQRLVKLRILQVSCDELRQGYYCFRVEADNLLFRWLLEPIELTYQQLFVASAEASLSAPSSIGGLPAKGLSADDSGQKSTERNGLAREQAVMSSMTSETGSTHGAIETGHSVRLARFKGLANLHGAQGQGLTVDIRYNYAKSWVF